VKLEVRDSGGSEAVAESKDFTIDGIRPFVVETDPVDGAEKVEIEKVLTIRFSEEMNREEVKKALRLKLGEEVVGIKEWRWEEGVKLEIVPEKLLPGEEYCLEISKEATDKSLPGNKLLIKGEEGEERDLLKVRFKVASGWIRGEVVRRGDGKRIKRAELRLKQGEKLIRETKVKKGEFLIEKLGAGEYEIEVKAKGYRVGKLSGVQVEWNKETVVKIELEKEVSELTLDQNRPNPFYPLKDERTEIWYGLPERVTQLRLEIYNLVGELVKVLVDEENVAAGGYYISWDGRSEAGNLVASGTYVLFLQADGKYLRRLMVVVK
jgi:hypothetical protein